MMLSKKIVAPAGFEVIVIAPTVGVGTGVAAGVGAGKTVKSLRLVARNTVISLTMRASFMELLLLPIYGEGYGTA